MRKGQSLNKRCYENWTATCKRMEVGHYIVPHTKINSICTKNLNIGPETIKLLEENINS